MHDKRSYVRYAGEGGRFLWDNECGVQWHNMEAGNKTDWLLFFDICREQPSPYTESIITAIMNGLCPHKEKADEELSRSGLSGREGIDWLTKTFWYFREDRNGFGTNSVPEFAGKSAPFYFWKGASDSDLRWRHPHLRSTLVPIARTYSPERRQFRSESWKVHRFDH